MYSENDSSAGTRDGNAVPNDVLDGCSRDPIPHNQGTTSSNGQSHRVDSTTSGAGPHPGPSPNVTWATVADVRLSLSDTVLDALLG